MEKKLINLCYVGIYGPTAPRDRVYLEGLAQRGVLIRQCVDASPGIRKYLRIIQKFAAEESPSIVWVGYLSTVVVPLIRLCSPRQKIVFNALSSMYETYVLDRGKFSRANPISWALWLLDVCAFHCATLSLVESNAQKEFIHRYFLVPYPKLKVVYTGTNEEVFFPDLAITKRPQFTVVFRGIFLPATGIQYVLTAAKLLKGEDISFVVIGWGDMREFVKNYIEREKLTHLEWIHVFLTPCELRERILSAHVMLGQFSNNRRLDRTIQHKTLEALALGMPYITRDSVSNREIMTNGHDCLMTLPASAKDLVEKIKYLRSHSEVRTALGVEARKTYEKSLSQELLTRQVLQLLEEL